jgi:hypothetical protein
MSVRRMVPPDVIGVDPTDAASALGIPAIIGSLRS